MQPGRPWKKVGNTRRVVDASSSSQTGGVEKNPPSFHDGSVNDGLDVVLSVPRVDDTLPLGVLFDVVLGEDLEAHVGRH